ncbi:MAG TPA: hypothetical protein VF170_17735 [Planctomycetaceae bacterium]
MYSFLLNRALLPGALALTESSFLRLASGSSKRQFFSPEAIRNLQVERLRGLLSHAAERVAFYRDRFADAGCRPDKFAGLDDLERYPSLTKEEIQANFPDRMVAGAASNDGWRWIGTRGTTSRLMVIQDFRKRDQARANAVVALTADCRYRLGHRTVYIPPDECSALCGVEGLRESSVSRQLRRMFSSRRVRDQIALSDLRGLVMNNWVERKTLLEPFGPDGTHIPDERCASYVRRLRETRPILLKALPEYLLTIARYAERTGDRLPVVPVVRPMGALMTGTVKREVARAFRGAVREDYGSREFGAMAFECREGHGLHVLSDGFVIEVMRDGRPAADGELGQVLVTDLQNRAMPLIRYRIGDLGRIERGPCRCGRSTPRLFLEGRSADACATADGRLLTSAAAAEFFYNRSEVDQFQLVERSLRHWELQVVPKGRFARDWTDLLESFRRFSGDPRRLSVREVRTIQPESSGKFRHVKSRLAPAV